MQALDFDEFGRVLSDTNTGFQPFGVARGLMTALDPAVRDAISNAAAGVIGGTTLGARTRALASTAGAPPRATAPGPRKSS